jgi:hypothetical protein
MKEHISKTIDDVTRLLSDLRGIPSVLAFLDSYLPDATPAGPQLRNLQIIPDEDGKPAAVVTFKPAPAKSKASEAATVREYRAAKKAANGSEKAKKPQTVGLHGRVMEIAAQCGMTFSQADVYHASGGSIRLDQVRGALAYAAKTKKIVVMTPGKPGSPIVYRMRNGMANLPKFGTAKASAPSQSGRIAIPGLDDETDQVKLERAIYSINPITEAVARGLMERYRNVPVERYELPRISDKVRDDDGDPCPDQED